MTFSASNFQKSFPLRSGTPELHGEEFLEPLLEGDKENSHRAVQNCHAVENACNLHAQATTNRAPVTAQKVFHSPMPNFNPNPISPNESISQTERRQRKRQKVMPTLIQTLPSSVARNSNSSGGHMMRLRSGRTIESPGSGGTQGSKTSRRSARASPVPLMAMPEDVCMEACAQETTRCTSTATSSANTNGAGISLGKRPNTLNATSSTDVNAGTSSGGVQHSGYRFDDMYGDESWKKI